MERSDGVVGCEKVNVLSMLVRCDEEADSTNCCTSVVSCATLVCCALVVRLEIAGGCEITDVI